MDNEERGTPQELFVPRHVGSSHLTAAVRPVHFERGQYLIWTAVHKETVWDQETGAWRDLAAAAD